MLGFLTPWIFGASVVAALATVAAHLLSVRRPPLLMLPTARFIAPRDVRAVSRTARPSDLVLLALRLLALLLAGAAVAGPRWTPRARAAAHIIVADRGWSADSARLPSIAGIRADAPPSATRIVWLDTLVRDSGAASGMRLHGMRAELGAAWPAVWRAAGALLAERPSLDSVAVHVMAPARSQSVAGWDAWRATWPGRVRTHLPPGAASMRADSSAPWSGVALNVTGARGDDPAVAALARLGVMRRAAAGAGNTAGNAAGDATEGARAGVDSRGARAILLSRAPAVEPSMIADSGTILLDWPESGTPRGWSPHSDTVGAIAARGMALVAPWIRTARYVGAERTPTVSVSSGDPDGARVIAWWSDGEPAAVEIARGGRSCTRQVGVRVASGSDLLLSPSAAGLLAALVAPCGAHLAAVPDRIVADSSGALANGAALRALQRTPDAITPPWFPAALLGGALLLLLAEWMLRGRRTAGEVGAATGAATRERAAA